MTEKTNAEKLDGVVASLTILKPRLTTEYRDMLETCVEWLNEVKADIAEADK